MGSKESPSHKLHTQSSVQDGLSPTELAELRFLFNMADINGGGTIERDELAALISRLGVKTTQADMEYWLGDYDENQDGEIDFEEFCSAMKRKVFQMRQHSRKDIVAAFKFISHPDHPGHVHRGVLTKLLAEYGHENALDREEALQLVNALDVGPENLINYVALVKKMYD